MCFPFQLILCHLLRPLLECLVIPPFKIYPIAISEGLNLSPIASIVCRGTLTLFLPGTELDNCFDNFLISSLPVCVLTITSWMDAKVCARSFRRNGNVALRRCCHSGAQRCQTYRDFRIAWWPASLTRLSAGEFFNVILVGWKRNWSKCLLRLDLDKVLFVSDSFCWH